MWHDAKIKTIGKNMKKQIVVAIMVLVFASMLCGKVAAANSPGPAPNSGDGVSDGSGFEPTTSTVEIVLVILLVGLLLIFFLFKRRKMLVPLGHCSFGGFFKRSLAL
jgi:hypothetical protein